MSRCLSVLLFPSRAEESGQHARGRRRQNERKRAKKPVQTINADGGLFLKRVSVVYLLRRSAIARHTRFPMRFWFQSAPPSHLDDGQADRHGLYTPFILTWKPISHTGPTKILRIPWIDRLAISKSQKSPITFIDDNRVDEPDMLRSQQWTRACVWQEK